MTTTIMGRCPRTGQLGIAAATHTLAAGGLHFYHVQPDAGIIAHQSAGDFDLARLGLRLLETGFSPDKILADLTASDQHPDYRQIGVLDRAGNPAASTGGKAHPWSGHIVGENFVAMVNSATSACYRRWPRPSSNQPIWISTSDCSARSKPNATRAVNPRGSARASSSFTTASTIR
jgi:uncharacterized Ntn-hydrolase superfamily protein